MRKTSVVAPGDTRIHSGLQLKPSVPGIPGVFRKLLL